VTREDFRRELGDAMDSISGSPDPSLPERVRAAVVHAPEERGPVWIGALAAAVIAVILVGVLLANNPLNHPPALGHGPTPTPSVAPSPSPTASPFVCGSAPVTVTNQTAPPVALIAAVRPGSHPPDYDRLVIEFKSSQTGTIKIAPQANSKFTMGASGATVTLAGKFGLLITIQGADNHTAYSGPTDFKTPKYLGIREVRYLGDFENTTQWGVGLSASACYQATMLTSPTRLVVDIRTS
jgi:hypothetical protein